MPSRSAGYHLEALGGPLALALLLDEPLRQRRGLADARLLCAGPGRLTQALALSGKDNRADLGAPPFELVAREAEPQVAAGPRIGITKAADRPWRYGIAGSRYLSRTMRSAE